MRTALRACMVALLLAFLTPGSSQQVQTQASGPTILLVVNPAAPNVFGGYLAEVLRAEGLNSFAVTPLASVTAGQLSTTPLVVLAETSLTASQATLFNDYVAGGGRLVTMRPDAQLHTTLGVSATGATQAGGYIRIEQGQSTGAGLSGVTLPFRGTATHYTSGTATTLATLFADRDTATAFPAVVRNGTTVTWAFDLARSVAYTRQGDPALAGVERDGEPPVRTTDIFFENIDLERVPVPHADMLMRLFALSIQDLLATSYPAPKLWYFPGDSRTVLVLTSDTHLVSPDPVAQLIAAVESRGGRLSTYVSHWTMQDAASQMATWRAAGHEFGVHPYAFMDGGTLDAGYTTAEDYFAAQGFGQPSATVRHHQIEWQGWTTAAQVAANHGIGLETSFYTWGPSVSFTATHPNGRPIQAHGFINGSGLPMRFVDSVGAILPTYQQTTSLIDEQLVNVGSQYTENLLPAEALVISRELIDNSQAGGYSALTTQFHADYYPFGEVQPWVNGTMDYATSLGIPMWTAERWLNFNLARAATTLGQPTWNGTTRQLAFTVGVPAGGEAQTLTVPATYAGRLVSAVTVDGVTTAFTALTIGGRSTVFFAVSPLASGAARTVIATYNATAPNQSPLAGSDAAATNYNSAATINVLANDTDPDGDALTVTAAGPAGRGMATVNPGGGSVLYTPTANLCGVDTFPYTISDGRGGTAVGSVTVTVACPANTPPTAAADSATTLFNTAASIAVLVNDADVDGDALTVSAVGTATRGVTAIGPGATSVTYTPTNGLCGPDSFTYTISDGRGGLATATVTITVGCTSAFTHTTVTDFSSCPTVVLAGTQVTLGGDGDVRLAGAFDETYASSTLGAQWIAGTWAGGPLTPAIADGILSLGGSAGAYVRSATAQPVAGLSARAQFGATAWQHLGFAAVDFAGDQYLIFSTFNQGTRLYARSNLGGGESRTDLGVIPAGFHDYRIERVTAGDGEHVRYVIDGAIVADHVFATAVPALNVYQSHNSGVTAPTLDVDSISITPPYVASGTFDSCPMDAGTPVTWTTSTWNATVPGGTTLGLRTRTSNDLATWSAWSGQATASGAAVTSPSARYIQYRLELTTNSTTVSPIVDSVTIGTAPFDAQPVAVNDAASTDYNTPVTITALANDSDPDNDPLTITAAGPAGRGAVTITGGGTTLLYTPTTNLCGPDAFTYTVSDGRGGAAAATVTVSVACPQNLPPIVGDDTASTPFNTPVAIAVLANDTDGNADPLIVAAVGAAARGTVSIAPNGQSVTYAPTTGLCGPDTFTYTVSDGHGGSAAGTVTVTVGCTTGLTQTTRADFGSCSATLSGTQITNLVDGELQLAGAFNESYAAAPLGAPWIAGTWAGGALTPTIAGGVLSLGGVDGAYVRSAAPMTVGALSARAQFAAAPWQHIGWAAVDFAGDQYLIFSTFNQSSRLFARSNLGNGETRTDLGVAPAGFHVYRVERVTAVDTTEHIRYLIDDVVVAEHVFTAAVPALNVYQSINSATVGDTLDVDSIAVTPPFAAAGAFDSCPMDAGTPVGWTTASWAATLPSGTSVAVRTRTSDDLTTWSDWSAPLTESGAAITSPAGRYLQYRAELATTDPAVSPVVASVSMVTSGQAGTPPSVSVVPASGVEGDVATGDLLVTVSLSAATDRAVTVGYATTAGTAAANADYVTTSGTVTIPAGATTATAALPVLGDLVDEDDETLTVTLSTPVNATIGTGSAPATIVDNDPGPVVSVSVAAAVTEGTGAAVDATVTVSLSTASQRTVSVGYATVDGSAVAGLDYTTTSGTVVFAPGTTSQTVAIPVAADALYEATETFTLTLSAPVNASVGAGSGVVSIADDDPQPSVSIAGGAVSEGDTGSSPISLTVTLSAVSGQTVTVGYATADGPALSGQDYNAATGTVTFAPGVTTQTVVLSVLGDVLDETDETFTVALSAPVNAMVGGVPATTTITDNDPVPTLAIDSVGLTEGTGGSIGMVFTVTLSLVSGRAVGVNYGTTAGSATAGSDYTTTSGTLSFPAGTVTQTITVPVMGDSLDENSETFTMTLTAPANATIATATGTGTITDDDPPPTVSINGVTATEGNSGSSAVTFTATLSAPSALAISVGYATAPGTALAASDYVATSGTLTFPAGTTTRTFTVAIVGDTVDEQTESFSVSLNTPVNVTIAGGGTGTITDNDIRTISIGNASVGEGSSGTPVLTLTVSLSAATSQTITVNYATNPGSGTATAGTDYTTTSGALTFTPGSSSRTFTVPVAPDTLDEANETLTATINSAVNAIIGTATGTGTITDDDAAPTVAIADASVPEGDSGSLPAQFVVTLSTASGRQTSVNYTTGTSGTATSNVDFTATGGTLTFPAGVTSLTISVPVLGDTTNEVNETFAVTLSSLTNLSALDTSATGTIVENDPLPVVSIANASQSEAALGNSTMAFTVTLSRPSSRSVTVRYSTANGTATAGSDYNAVSNVLRTIPAGQTQASFNVTIRGDFSDEPNETFTVTLTLPTNATIGTGTGTGTIIDND